VVGDIAATIWTYGWRYIHAGRDRTCWLLPTTTRSEAEGRQPWGFGGRPPRCYLSLGSGCGAARQVGAAAPEVEHGHGDERFGVR